MCEWFILCRDIFSRFSFAFCSFTRFRLYFSLFFSLPMMLSGLASHWRHRMKSVAVHLQESELFLYRLISSFVSRLLTDTRHDNEERTDRYSLSQKFPHYTKIHRRLNTITVITFRCKSSFTLDDVFASLPWLMICDVK